MKPGPDQIVRKTLATATVHEGWEARYRINGRKASPAFTQACAFLAQSPEPILDAGCGPAVYALRLVERGFRVRGIDFSPAAIEMAQTNINAAHAQDRVTVAQGDLTALAFPDRAFEQSFCWGVLMHIPGVSSAIAELCRVTAHKIVVSEANCRSPEGRLIRLVRRPSRVPAGLEIWHQTETGPLFVRIADPKWLAREFGRHGFQLRARIPSRLTEIDTKLPRPLAAPLRWANGWWPRTHWAGPAIGNVLLFERVRA